MNRFIYGTQKKKVNMQLETNLISEIEKLETGQSVPDFNILEQKKNKN